MSIAVDFREETAVVYFQAAAAGKTSLWTKLSITSGEGAKSLGICHTSFKAAIEANKKCVRGPLVQR